MAIRQSRKTQNQYHIPGKGALSVGELATNPNKVILEQAGIHDSRKLKMVKGAVDVVEAGLKATYRKYFHDSKAGKIVSTAPLVDHEQRRRNAELALMIAGIKLRDAAPPTQMQVNILLPDLTSQGRGQGSEVPITIDKRPDPLPPSDF